LKHSAQTVKQGCGSGSTLKEAGSGSKLGSD